MKNLAIFILLCSQLPVFAQDNKRPTTAVYVELTASIDALGNIYISPIPKRNSAHLDSLEIVNINNVIRQSNRAVDVLNGLAKSGWHLVSVCSVSPDRESRPNNLLLLYYLRKG